jgi:hypothetical protein
MKVLSHIFSWVFLPLFMPAYGLLISLYYPSEALVYSSMNMFNIPPDIKSQLFWLFFIFSCAAPGLSFVMLHQRKIITTIDMENARERNIPLLIMFAYCAFLYALFLYKAPNGLLPKYFYALPLSGTIVTACFIYINRWIKISMHAGGGGILCGYLVAFFITQTQAPILLIALAFLVSGLTISARLYLKKHEEIEVYAGWLLAFAITFSCNWFYPS